jgi:hypothetical protein
MGRKLTERSWLARRFPGAKTFLPSPTSSRDLVTTQPSAVNATSSAMCTSCPAGAAQENQTIAGLCPKPYTLHPTPYTLHPAPCTLHPKPVQGFGLSLDDLWLLKMGRVWAK